MGRKYIFRTILRETEKMYIKVPSACQLLSIKFPVLFSFGTVLSLLQFLPISNSKKYSSHFFPTSFLLLLLLF